MPRFQFAGAMYHVTSHACADRALFRDDVDRYAFLAITATSVARCGWACLSYCLLTTHYHLLIETPAENLAEGMQRLNWLYARSFNRRHGGRGHVFDARYGAVLIQTDSHLLEVIRYQALNPVRAGLCGDPARWPWSSYRSTLGLVEDDSFVATQRVLELFGPSRERARRELRAFVDAGLVAAYAL